MTTFHFLEQKLSNFFVGILVETMTPRDVSTGATGATWVAPKFLDTLTLLQPGGQILPTIGTVAPKLTLWLRPCTELGVNLYLDPLQGPGQMMRWLCVTIVHK